MRTDQGLTLLEVLAAVVLLSLLAAAVTPLLRDAIRAYGSVAVEAAAISTEDGEPIVLVRGDALQGTWRVVIVNGVAVCRWFPEEAEKRTGRGPR